MYAEDSAKTTLGNAKEARVQSPMEKVTARVRELDNRIRGLTELGLSLRNTMMESADSMMGEDAACVDKERFDEEQVRASPPFGGAMGELVKALDSMEEDITAAFAAMHDLGYQCSRNRFA